MTQPPPAVRRGPTGVLLGAAVAPLALGVSTTAIALPSISEALSLSRPQAAWILAAYLLAQAMCVSIFGRLCDVRGIRWTLIWAGVLLAGGSVLAIASTSFESLVLARLIQGAGAGSLMVTSFGIVGARFGPDDRPKVLGTMTAFIGIVSGSGTLIGGVMTDSVSWRAVVALPVLSVLLLPRCLRLAPPAPAGTGRVDALGAGLLATLAAVTVVLLESPSIDIGGVALVVLVAIGLASAALLAQRVRTVPDCFVPRTIVRDRRFVWAAVSGLTIFAAYVATLFSVPLMLTASHGWSATRIGVTLLPAAVVGAAAAWIVGALSARFDPFRIAAVLAAASAAGVLLAGAGNGAAVPSAAGLALVLAGITGASVTLVARVPLMVDAGVRNVAAGLFTLTFQVGGAFGTAMVAGLDAPLGQSGALACVAVLPLCGVGLALMARAAGTPPVPGPAVGARSQPHPHPHSRPLPSEAPR